MRKLNKRPGRLKRLTDLTDQKTRRRLRSFRKARKKRLSREQELKNSGVKLKKLWQHLMEKEPTKPNLCYIILNIPHREVQEMAWTELSKRQDLVFDDLYEMLEKIDNELLIENVWQKCLQLDIIPDDLLCIIRFKNTFRTKAWNEFLSRFRSGQIKEYCAKRILIQIITYVENLRTEAWNEFKNLNPSYEELSGLVASIPNIGFFTLLTDEIQTLIKRKTKGADCNFKIVQQMHKIADLITKLQVP